MDEQQPPVEERPVQATLVAETTWLDTIVEFNVKHVDQKGSRVLSFTLVNGHRYCLVLTPDTPLMAAVQKAVSPVVIAGADALPRNGHGA